VLDYRPTGSGLLVPPKFHTPRDETFPTRGSMQGVFAQVWLGKPLTPAQQLIADVTGEYDPVTLLPRYTLCVVTMQRQAGKSHLSMAQNGERCFSRPKFRSWYTAQTGQDARDQFLKFHDDVVEGAPLEHVVRTLRGNGHEVMRFPNLSMIRPHPPTPKALHGKQVDRNDIDEAWAFTVADGKALVQASSPAKLTRPGAQTFIWSAGGTTDSTWLAELVARGRGGDPTIAYFEWGVPDELEVPEAGDLDGLQTWAEYHPAYGHFVSLDSFKALRTDIPDDDEFARGGGNRWTDIIGGAIPEPVWEAVRYPDPVPDDAPIGYGTARAMDGTHVAVAAAVQLDDGRKVVELLDIIPAYDAADTVTGWAGGDTLAVATTGASAPLADALADYHRLERMVDRDQGAAVANLLDGLPMEGRPARVFFRRHPAMDAAREAAALRTVGDGGKAWARASSSAPIAAIEAATAALWALDHRHDMGALVSVFSAD
jgi:hypothetical protein